MFGKNEALDSSTVQRDSTTLTIDHDRHPDVIPIRRTSPARLAELVHHLSDVPVSEARRAIRRTDNACGEGDPLTIVAAALLHIRRDAQRCARV